MVVLNDDQCIPLVNVPGVNANATLTQYLSSLYNFVISVVGIFAMAVIVYGGMRYLTSAGNPAAVEEAKDAIMSAIYGLILALMSWLIINIVNPDILVLKNPGVGLATGTYSAGANTAKCSFGAGDGTADNPCSCIDGVKAVSNITTTTLAPAVVSTSIIPCSENVPTSTSSISITFNEPVILTGPNAIVLGPANPTFTPSWTSGVLTGGNTVTLTLNGPLLTSAYMITVVAASVKDAKGTLMASNFKEQFIAGRALNCGLDTCPCVFTGFSAGTSVCDITCSDASKQTSVNPDPPGIGYHCVGPRILATGTNVVMNPDGVSANMKVNGDVTLDGITNSIFSNNTVKAGSTYEWTINPGGVTATDPKLSRINRVIFS